MNKERTKGGISLIEGTLYLSDALENVVVAGSQIAIMRYFNPPDVLISDPLGEDLKSKPD